RAGRTAPGVRDDAGVGIDLADRAIPEPPQFKKPLLMPKDVSAPRRILRVARTGKLMSRYLAEVVPTVLAVTHPGAVPAVDENPVDHVPRHDFLMHVRHEFEVVGAKCAGNPHFGGGPMAA